MYQKLFVVRIKNRNKKISVSEKNQTKNKTNKKEERMKSYTKVTEEKVHSSRTNEIESRKDLKPYHRTRLLSRDYSGFFH